MESWLTVSQDIKNVILEISADKNRARKRVEPQARRVKRSCQQEGREQGLVQKKHGELADGESK